MPRFLAAASAALVLSEMRFASSWATMAMMPTVSWLAFGIRIVVVEGLEWLMLQHARVRAHRD